MSNTDPTELSAGYKPPAEVDLSTLMKLDPDDESLQRYKKNLLGGGGE